MVKSQESVLDTVWDTKSESFVVLPEDIEMYNGGIRCDMAEGPCACGA